MTRNPFAAPSSTSAASHPNPFAKKPASNAPAAKGPFQGGASTQKPSPSAFGAKNPGATFGATSQAGTERTPSPFGMPSNQGMRILNILHRYLLTI